MIKLSGISKAYGGQVLFDDLSFNVNKRERVGLVGRNGHGKTTLFRMILGEETADAGEIMMPRRYRIGRLEHTFTLRSRPFSPKPASACPTPQERGMAGREDPVPDSASVRMTCRCRPNGSRVGIRCASTSPRCWYPNRTCSSSTSRPTTSTSSRSAGLGASCAPGVMNSSSSRTIARSWTASSPIPSPSTAAAPRRSRATRARCTRRFCRKKRSTRRLAPTTTRSDRRSNASSPAFGRRTHWRRGSSRASSSWPSTKSWINSIAFKRSTFPSTTRPSRPRLRCEPRS